jgi:hypothetical protein
LVYKKTYKDKTVKILGFKSSVAPRRQLQLGNFGLPVNRDGDGAAKKKGVERRCISLSLSLFPSPLPLLVPSLFFATESHNEKISQKDACEGGYVRSVTENVCSLLPIKE